MYRIIAIADGNSVWNAGSARAVVGARRHGGESAAGRGRTVGAGHAGIDFDFGYLTARLPFVPHQAEMKLVPLRVLKLRLLEFMVEAVAACSSEM